MRSFSFALMTFREGLEELQKDLLMIERSLRFAADRHLGADMKSLSDWAVARTAAETSGSLYAAMPTTCARVSGDGGATTAADERTEMCIGCKEGKAGEASSAPDAAEDVRGYRAARGACRNPRPRRLKRRLLCKATARGSKQ